MTAFLLVLLTLVLLTGISRLRQAISDEDDTTTAKQAARIAVYQFITAGFIIWILGRGWA